MRVLVRKYLVRFGLALTGFGLMVELGLMSQH